MISGNIGAGGPVKKYPDKSGPHGPSPGSWVGCRRAELESDAGAKARGLVLHAILAFACLSVATTLAPAAQAAANPCASMLQANLRNVRVLSASDVAGKLPELEPQIAPENRLIAGVHEDDPDLRDLPRFCRVIATVSPVAKSRIVVELWLPEQWNGKLLAIGNHGFAGELEHADMGMGLHRGYAVAASDVGHTAPKDSKASGRFAADNGAAADDFAWRGAHEMAVLGKTMVQMHYGSPARRAYFDTCSNGGRQAIREAQQFPADFDGIIAGSAAQYWTQSFAHDLWHYQSLRLSTGGLLSDAKLTLARKAAVAACDKLDGLADGLIANPTQCRWRPRDIQCKAGADTGACLTAAEVAALEKIESPLKDPKTGKVLFKGMMAGGEDQWGNWENLVPSVANFFRDTVVHDPDWDSLKADMPRLVAMSQAPGAFGAKIDTTNPDLSKFRARGGKLIQFHGWNDQSFPPGHIVDYYTEVVDVQPGPDKLAKTHDFYRLFMVPGMRHCRGGYGPIYFGALTHPALPTLDADHDILEALDRWVDKKAAPDRLIATQFAGAEGPQRQMPLCPYPQTAAYVSGDVNHAESFACKAPVRKTASR
jgi:hypothetical protein